MMTKELIDTIRELLAFRIPYEVGSPQFYILWFVVVVTWVLVARLFLGILKSDRGFIVTLLSFGVTLFMGLLAYRLADSHVVPKVNADWADSYLAIAACVVVTLLVILFLAKRVFLVSWPTGTLVFIFASAAAVTACFGTVLILKTLETGGGEIQQREERTRREIESVL